MNKPFTYKPEILVGMAQEYLQAEHSYREYIREHTNKYGVIRLETVDAGIWYWVKEKESHCTWDALRSACRMVDADMETVLSTAKAMNRYERREQWQVCAHLPSGWCSECGEYGEYGEERVRRFFAERAWDAGYFQSTGRKHPWTA